MFSSPVRFFNEINLALQKGHGLTGKDDTLTPYFANQFTAAFGDLACFESVLAEFG